MNRFAQSDWLFGFITVAIAFPLLLGWHPVPTLGTISEFLGVAIFSLVATCLMVDQRLKWRGFVVSPASICLIVIICITILQGMFFNFTYNAFWLSPLFTLLLALFLHQAWLSIGVDKNLNRYLAAVALIVSVFNGVVGFLQFWGIDWFLSIGGGYIFFSDPNVNVAEGNVAQKNILSSLCLIGMGASALFLRGWSQKRYWAMLFFLAYVVALTGSRTPMAILIAISAVWVFNRLIRHRNPSRPLVEIALVVLLMQILTPIINQNVTTIFGVSTYGDAGVDRILGGGGMQARFDLWGMAIQLSAENPLLGIGWKNFADGFLSLSLLNGGWQADVLGSNAHNIVLQLAAECGVLGGLSILMAIGFLSLSHASNDETRVFQYLGVVVLIVHSLLEYPLWHPAILYMFICMVADVERDGLHWTGRILQPKFFKFPRVGLIGAGVGLAFSCVSAISAIQLVALSDQWQKLGTRIADQRTHVSSFGAGWNPLLAPYQDWIYANDPRLSRGERIKLLKNVVRWLPESFVLRRLRDEHLATGSIDEALHYQRVLTDVYGIR